MRTILPSNDAGLFTTSHTFTSTGAAACACNPHPNAKKHTNQNNKTLHKTLSSRCFSRIGNNR